MAPTHQRPNDTSPARLNSLDAGFMALESPQAPMHLGFAAFFTPPSDGPRPSFETLRAHIEARLDRAPRYRQRLLEVPLGLAEPVWVDDERFDLARHVRRASATDLGELADEVMSMPLASGRPLWELWIAERLDDGHLGVVGKAHHCLVDGLAAVELMGLLLDPTPKPEYGPPQEWHPTPTPSARALVGAALHHRATRSLAGARRAVNLAQSPGRVRELARRAVNAALSLSHDALPLAPHSLLNGPMSPARHVAWNSRPVEDLKLIERQFGTTINDIFLAASASAIRELLLARSGHIKRLKAMVPVSVRAPEERWGNRIAFVFPGLPCEEPDAVRRLCDVHAAMSARKRAHTAEAADTVMGAVGRAPRLVRDLGSRLLTSPRLSNLTISNVPGPEVPLYLKGCQVRRVYPVVPLAAGHGISIGMTSFNGTACFGVYADGGRAAEADHLARGLGEAIDELLTRCRGGAATPRVGAVRSALRCEEPSRVRPIGLGGGRLQVRRCGRTSQTEHDRTRTTRRDPQAPRTAASPLAP